MMLQAQWPTQASQCFAVPTSGNSNASTTFPGIPAVTVKPEATNTMWSDTVAPLPLIEPPCAGTPFTVGNAGSVSKSHKILPSAAAYARRWPSIAPEKTTSFATVTAANCPPLQPGLPSQSVFGGIVFHRILPVRISIAANPPGGGAFAPAEVSVEISEFAAYTFLPSVADPHSIPPSPLPLPMRASHNSFPPSSGSSPYITPVFWPHSSTRCPSPRSTRIGDDPKSTSGPGRAAQFRCRGSRHPKLNTSCGVFCCTHSRLPVAKSNATTASVPSAAGSTYASPVPTYSRQ